MFLRSLWIKTLLLFFLSAVVGLTTGSILIPNLPPLLSQTSSSPSTVLASSGLPSRHVWINNDNSLMDSTNHLPSPLCQGREYGRNLNVANCLNVLASIPSDNIVRTYGPRTLATYEIPLPHRWLSDDGLCAIDVDRSKSGFEDRAPGADIYNAAKLLVDRCVIHRSYTTSAIGGILNQVGQNKKLNVILKPYDPQVHCFAEPTFNDRGQCSKVLDILPTVRARQDFGRDEGLPNHIPHSGKLFAEPSRSCIAEVQLVETDKVKCSWYELWAGAVAVNKLCVEIGESGISYGHGDSAGAGGVMIALGEPSNLPLEIALVS